MVQNTDRTTYASRRLQKAEDSGNQIRVQELTPSMDCRTCSHRTADLTNFRHLDATDYDMPIHRFCDPYCYLRKMASRGVTVAWRDVEGWFVSHAKKQLQSSTWQSSTWLQREKVRCTWLQREKVRWTAECNSIY